MAGFERIAPHLTDPLVLIGFCLFVSAGLMKTVLAARKGGLLELINGRQIAGIIRSMMRYVFMLAILITFLGFGLKGYEDYQKAVIPNRNYHALQEQTKQLEAQLDAESKLLRQLKDEFEHYAKRNQAAHSTNVAGKKEMPYFLNHITKAIPYGEVGAQMPGRERLVGANIACELTTPRQLLIAQDSVDQILSKKHFLAVANLKHQLVPLAEELRDLRGQIQRTCELAAQDRLGDTQAYKNLLRRAAAQGLAVSKLADKADQYAKSFNSEEDKKADTPE